MQKKIQYLDSLRIFATLCVILLHCINPYFTNVALFSTKTWWVCNLLNSVTRTGVPLFFMISGFLLLTDEKTLNFADFYKRRLKKIIVPFFVWDVIYYVINRTSAGLSVFSLDFFKELFVSGSEYHLWFVYTLTGIYLFLPFMKRILDGCTLKQSLWLLVLVTFASTLRPFFNTVTPFYVYLFEPIMDGYFGFFILGYVLGKYDIPAKVRTLVYAGGVAGFVLGVCGNYALSSPDSLNLFFNGGYQINHFLCAAAVFVIFRHFKKIQNPALVKVISSFSSLTFEIYLIHVLVLTKLYEHLALFSPSAEIVVFFFLTLVISTAAAFVISKAKAIPRKFRKK